MALCGLGHQRACNSRECRNLVDAAPEERKILAQVREPWVRLEK